MGSLGKRLRYAREGKRLSQVDVFKKTGINNKTLSRYENDGTEPDADSLRRLAELYEVSTDWIIGSKTESDYTLPASEFERIIKELEEEHDIVLHGKPLAHQAVRQALEMLVKALKSSE